jgi:uncharacterized protein YjbI with pentapeptide repeats
LVVFKEIKVNNLKKENKKIAKLISSREKNFKEIYNSNYEKFNNEYGTEKKTIEGTAAYLREDFFEFTENEYIFYTFKNKTFGKSVAIAEEHFLKISNMHISYNTFINCSFSNVIFENCTFFGCKFINCKTSSSSVIFRNCSFSSPFIDLENDSEIENNFTIFQGFNGSVKFDDCRLEEFTAINCTFIHAKFIDCDMTRAIIDNGTLFSVSISGCDMRGTKISNPRCKDFVIEDDYKISKFGKETFLGEVRVENISYDDSYKVYQNFSEQFRKNNLMDLYGEYFYLFKRNELKELSGIEKILSFFALISFGYGEKVKNTILCVVFIILFTPILYMIFGVNFDGELLKFTFETDRENMLSIGQLFNYYTSFFEYGFSVLFNINYGSNFPVGFSKVIYYLEKLIGYILVGLFIATLTRKMAR